jgi:hypothetical protein
MLQELTNNNLLSMEITYYRLVADFVGIGCRRFEKQPGREFRTENGRVATEPGSSIECGVKKGSRRSHAKSCGDTGSLAHLEEEEK